MNEQTLIALMNQRCINLVGEMSLDERAIAWQRAVKIVIEPKDVSDRTCIRNVSRWLVGKVNDGVFNEYEIFRRVLDFAIEASGPNSKNQYAVFMHILKKELGYLKL